MSKNKKDQHNAAKNGRKGEALFTETMEKNNYTCLWKIEHFEKHYGQEGRDIHEMLMVLDIPETIKDTQPEEIAKTYYSPDRYLPDLGMIVEIKYSEKNGTTDEKIFYDLYKIQNGVYKDEFLLYVFIGPNAIHQPLFHTFAAEVKKLDPYEQKIKVIIDSSPDLEKVVSFLNEKKYSSYRNSLTRYYKQDILNKKEIKWKHPVYDILEARIKFCHLYSK